MKKILIFIITFIFMTHVSAYDSNVAGVIVKPSVSTSVTDKSCPTGAYYLAGQKSYMLGLRISFYDNTGKQIGKTIDVWNQNVVSEKKSTQIIDTEDGKIAHNNGYILYKTKINHANALPSRMDYHNGFSFALTGGDYYYYTDNKVTGNELTYTKDAAAEMKKYFTTPEVVQRYINIANASEKLSVYQDDYVIVLETLVKVAACGSGIYGGVYTVADFGSLVRQKEYINNYNLRCNVVKYLSLERDGAIGNVTFVKPDLASKKCGYAKGNYTPNEVTTSNLGVGMGFVYGSEVCKENCTSGKKYKVIYHPIDLTNPFLTEDGEKRDISNESNWCKEPSSNSNTCKTVYPIDKNIYSGEPILTVTLTPASIRKIREDNKTIDYSKITNTTCKNFWNKFKTESIFSPTTNFCS